MARMIRVTNERKFKNGWGYPWKTDPDFTTTTVITEEQFNQYREMAEAMGRKFYEDEDKIWEANQTDCQTMYVHTYRKIDA